MADDFRLTDAMEGLEGLMSLERVESSRVSSSCSSVPFRAAASKPESAGKELAVV